MVTNIFGYSFVSFLESNYIQEKNLTFAPTGPKDKWLKLFTQRLMFKEKVLPFCCVNCVLTFCCITHKKSNIQHQKFDLNVFVYSNIFCCKYSFVSYSYHFFYTNIFEYSFVSKIHICHTLACIERCPPEPSRAGGLNFEK